MSIFDQLPTMSNRPVRPPEVIEITETVGRTPSGRRLGGADPAAVALALSGYSIYWTVPALAAARRRRRAPGR